MSEFLTIIDDNINRIINSLIPDCFTGKRCIIAGGMPLSIYSRYVKTAKEMWACVSKETRAERVAYTKFSDVDIWIINPESTNSKDLLDVMRHPLDIGDSIIVDDILFTRSKSSVFAATYAASNTGKITHSNTFQLMHSGIRNDIAINEAIEGLLDTFDLDLCKVAWHDGVLYAHKSVASCLASNSFGFSKFQTEKLSKIDSFSPGELAYLGLRYKKYSLRFNLDPSTEICNFAYKTLQSCSEKNLELTKTDIHNTPGLNTTVLGKAIHNPATFTLPSLDKLSDTSIINPAVFKLPALNILSDSASLYKNDDDSWGGSKLIRVCSEPDFFEWVFSLKNLEEKDSKMLYYVNDDRFSNVIKTKLESTNRSKQSLMKTYESLLRGRDSIDYGNFKIVKELKNKHLLSSYSVYPMITSSTP